MASTPRSATLRDVARVAGVSPSTASRVLNSSGTSVSPALAQRVLAVADSLGYVSNQAARALRGRRTSVVLLASDPRTASIAAIAAGMEEAGRERDVMVSITAAGSGTAAQLAALEVLGGLRPRALVVTGRSYAGESFDVVLPVLRRLQADGCSVVYIGDEATSFPAVRFDDVAIGQVVGRHAAERGTRAVILTAVGHPALESRRTGFLKGLADGGLEPASVRTVHCDMSHGGAVQGTFRAMEEPARPDLLLAGNDILAIGAISALQQLGLDVPRSVAVSGVDDIPLARDIAPSLTTVALPFHTAGRTALELALSGEASDVHLRSELVVRASTDRPTR